MPHHSYALVPFRRKAGEIHVLIGHMGGPFWARKDQGAWSFPKGQPEADDADGLATARREFAEELGIQAPNGDYIELGDIKQSGGKTVTAWAIEANINTNAFKPGEFSMEWPPNSGALTSFPEFDRIGWFEPDHARSLLVAAQATFIDRLLTRWGQG